MNSYIGIRYWILDQPLRVQFLPSEYLALQLKYWRDETDDCLKTNLLGEAIFRCWLEEDRLPVFVIELMAELDCIGPVPTFRGQEDDWNEFLGERDEIPALKQARLYAKRRILTLQDAHGIIPVLHARFQGSPAVPIPFQLDPGEERAGVVRAKCGRILEGWSSVVCKQNGHLELPSLRVTLQAHVEGECMGKSLGLPVCLAWKIRSGALPPVPELSVLSTGGLESDGSITVVEGLDQKAALAKQMGCTLFVHPGTEAESPYEHGFICFPGAQLGSVLCELCGHPLFQEHKSSRQCREDLKVLQEEVHFGRISPESAERKRLHLQSSLEGNVQDEDQKEAILLSTMLAGSLANHLGEAEQAAKWNREALVKAKEVGHYEWYTDAAAAEVVSLTDLGHLDKAKLKAESLLNWAQNLRAPLDPKRKALMKAHGVLGGQALLQMGLEKEALRLKSLSHLEKALKYAHECEDPREIAFDQCQIYLWQSLFEPENAIVSYYTTREEIHRNGKAAAVSLEFLKTYRLQAATRASQSNELNDYSFPPESFGWLRASAHKYRGMLFSREGASDLALVDYRLCLGLLAKESSPVLRFMYAAALLQAGEDLLPEKRIAALEFLNKSIEVFRSANPYLYGLYEDEAWINRAEGLLNGRSVSELANPAIYYRY